MVHVSCVSLLLSTQIALYREGEPLEVQLKGTAQAVAPTGSSVDMQYDQVLCNNTTLPVLYIGLHTIACTLTVTCINI